MTKPFKTYTHADFSLASEVWTYDQLEAATGLSPDRKQNRGDNPEGKGRYGNSALHFSSGLPEDADLSDKLDALIDRLRPTQQQLKVLLQTAPVYTRLVISVSSEGPEHHFWTAFSPSSLGFIGDIGVKLHLTVAHIEDVEREREKQRLRREEWLRKKQEALKDQSNDS